MVKRIWMHTFGGLMGGIIGGLHSAILLKYIIFKVGIPFQAEAYSALPLVFWGGIIGLGIAIGHPFTSSGTRPRLLFYLVIGTAGTALIGALGATILYETFWGGALFGGIFGFWIHSGCHLVSIGMTKFYRHRPSLLYSLPGGVLGGALAGISAGLLWGVFAGGARAEGYVLLVIILFMAIAMLWAGTSIIGIYFATQIKVRPSAKIVFFIASLLLLEGIFLITFQHDPAPITQDSLPPETHKEFDSIINHDFSQISRSTIIELIKKKQPPGISELTALYLLTKKQGYAVEIRELLLEEMREKKFTNPAHSIKALQLFAAMRAVSYLELEHLEGIFLPYEKEQLIDWFKDIVDRMFTIEWVDYLYAFAFKKKPAGPYENQEIGVGALAVLASVIEKKYPSVAQKCHEYIDHHAVVWGNNFRNTDDSVGYQSWWIYSAFLVAKYRPRPDWLTNVNAQKSFEWLLRQWPPNGTSLSYNDYYLANLADTMALGASLFHDGRYKWLAIKMLQQIDPEKGIHSPFYFGLTAWDDSLQPKIPSMGSVLLSGPGHLPHNPGPDRPDKIIFRDGWQNDDLYALLNLRYAGWHRYKATNAFVSIMYGRPFVVEDLIYKRHRWLPAGRAIYRDKKIDRNRLNGIQIGLKGYEQLVYDLVKVDSPWAQDPPQYAEIKYFHQIGTTEISKTSLSNWKNWDSQRLSIFVKKGYFLVVDHAKGLGPGKVAITWHLKGQEEIKNDHILLSQEKYQMGVYYPHSQDWYRVHVKKSIEVEPPTADIHAPDIDLSMISEDNSQVGFLTLFAPYDQKDFLKVQTIAIKDVHDQPAYPNAIGLHIHSEKYNDLIGIAFTKQTFRYEGIDTDTELFIIRQKPDHWSITYLYGTFINIPAPRKPVHITINLQNVKKHVDWSYEEEIVNIRLPSEKGELQVQFLEENTL